MSTEMSNPMFNTLWPWPQMLQGSFAPNAGWNFANLTVNYGNSTAPDVEKEIVSRHSYGRQLGRLTDVVEALVLAKPKTTRSEADEDFLKLVKEVREIKDSSTEARITALEKELTVLKKIQKNGKL